VDPDPAIFVIDFQDTNKKIILKKSFTANYFLKDPDPDPGGPKTYGSNGNVLSKQRDQVHF
jgi:hypothetical protein